MVASGQKVLGLEADGRGSWQQLALVAAGLMAPVAQAAVVEAAGSREGVWCLEGAGDGHKVQKVEAAGSDMMQIKFCITSFGICSLENLPRLMQSQASSAC